MFRKKKSRSLEHIASALVPSAAFAAVPNTPPPTPSPSRKMKRFGRKKKTPSPSPILPALLGVNLTTRAIGLSLGDVSNSSSRASPERSFLRDPSLDSHEEEFDGGYASIPARGRARRRLMEDGSGHARVVEAQITQATVPDNMEGRPADVYAEVQKKNRRRNENGGDQESMKSGMRPHKSRETSSLPSSKERSLHMSDVQEFNDTLGERQRKLEDKMQMQNRETRDMIREVMVRQHESSIRAGRNSDEISYDDEAFDMDNEALMDENSRLMKRNLTLVEQNKDLQAVSQTLSKDGKKGSPRSQVEAILDENDILRTTVHRLNAELEKFQEKYGDLPNKSKMKRQRDVLPEEPKPKWLTDVSYLSPLFISYDAQLKEKDEIIRSLEDIRDETTKDKWENLKEQNSLMAEEIQILMQQMEVSKQKTTETTRKHTKEVTQLSKKLAIAEAESEVSTEQVEKLRKELGSLKKTHEKLVEESAEKIPAKEHLDALNDLKSEMEDMKELHQRDLGKAMKKIKNIEEERSLLTLNNTDMKAKNRQLQGQIEALTQSYDKQLEKGKMLEAELEDTEKKIAECETHLAEVLRLTDKTSAERDALATLIEKEQRISEQALRKTMIGKYEMGKMEQTVKQYKKQAVNQMNDISDKIRGLEDSHQGRLEEYHREMSHLRRLLQDKQAMLDDVTHEKRLVENELENVWEATTKENRRIMDSLYKSKVLD